MSSSWSEIRSRSSDDPLLDTIADLQNRANQSEAVTDIAPTDKIPPIRIIKSRMELSDRKMMTGYVRPRTSSMTYQMPKEPDNDHLRLDIRFDSGVGVLSDYSMMGNQAKVGFSGALPILIKGTEDDGITTGDVVSVLDGKSNHYRIPINPNISVKQMVGDGKPGITVIYRHYPLIIKNEQRSGNTQRATMFWMIENDQVEYALRAEVDDAGYIYYFFRYQFVNYIVRSTNPVILPPLPPDHYIPDYTPDDYEAAEEYYSIVGPTPYIDLAFLFNFTTRGISLFLNGAQIPITTTNIALVPPLPTPIFPPAFADPPPPPETPQPYVQPFQEVYKQVSETGAVKVHAVTVTEQQSFYAVPPADATTDPIELLYNVPIGITTTNIDPDTGEEIDPINTAVVPGPATLVPLEQTVSYLGGAENQADTVGALGQGACDYTIFGIKVVSAASGLGQKLAGKQLNFVVLKARGVSTPVGFMYLRIWNSTGTVKATIGQFDTSLLDNPATAFTGGWHEPHFINMTSTVTIAEGDIIGLEYATGGSTDKVEVQRYTPSTDTSVAQVSRKVGSTEFMTNSYFLPYMLFYTSSTATGGGTGTGGGGTTPTPTAPPGKQGATDQYGVISAYGSGQWRNNYVLDYHSDSDSMRWDFEAVGANNFKSQELTVYCRSDDVPDDEITGILGGGTHGSGSSPKCYNVGIDTLTGATRYRMEEDHPDNITGKSGPAGVGIGSVWRGFRYVKWNRSNGVQLEIWQDKGNNEGTTPANEWTLVASWLESEYNWQQPPADHQISLRIDDMASDDQVEVKWLSIREILTTDPPAPTGGGGGTGGGGTGGGGTTPPPPPPTPTGPPGFEGPIQRLSNRTGERTFAGEIFSATSTIVNSIPTSMEFMVWRSADCTSGSVMVRHYSAITSPTQLPKDPILATPVTIGMKDYGGPKWSGATVHFIFAGTEWNTQTTPYSRQNVVDKINLLFASKYFDALIQYGIKRPKLGTIVTNTTTALPASITAANVSAVVNDSITRLQVPNISPTVNHMYVVIAPAGKVDSGGGSGVHASNTDVSNPTQNPLIYAWVSARSTIGSATNSITHRIIDTVTNPIFKNPPVIGVSGIVADTAILPSSQTALGLEAGDVCESDPGPLVNTVNVNPYYSNQDGACISPSTAPTWLSCPTGSTWDEAKQECVTNATTNAPLIKKDLLTIPVLSLPTTRPSTFNVVWQDTENLIPIVANDVIGIEVSGVTVGSVRVMNNLGNGGSAGSGLPNAEPDWSSLANYDMIGEMHAPDPPGAGITMSSTTNNAIAVKFISSSASAFGTELLGKVVHRISPVFKNAIRSSGALRWVIWDAAGNELFKTAPILNLMDVPHLTFSDFNVSFADQKIAMQEGYRIGFEFKTTTAGDTFTLKSSSTNLDSSFSVDVRSVAGTWSNLAGVDLDVILWTKKSQPVVYLPGTGGLETGLVLPPPKTLGMKDYGGPKWSGAQVHFIFAGTDWNTRVTPVSKDEIILKIRDLINSHHFDNLIQYGIKKPILGKIAILNLPELPNSYATTDVSSAVKAVQDLNLIPKNTNTQKHLYIVLSSFGITSANGFTSTSFVHNDNPADHADNPMVGAYITYQSTLDLFTQRIARHIISVMSNPLGPWHTPDDLSAEVGWWGDATVLGIPTTTARAMTSYCQDVLAKPAVIVDGVSVLPYYSNQDGGCNPSAATPTWVACQTGSVYDEKRQSCFSLTVPATGGGGTPTTGGGGGGGTVPTPPVNLTPIFSAPKTLGMKDYGGLKLNKSVLHVIYWGSGWNTQTTPWGRVHMDSAMNTLVQSHYYDSLIQYGIKRPKLGASVIATTYPIQNGFTSHDMALMVEDLWARNLIAKPQDADGTYHHYHVIPQKGIRPSNEVTIQPGVLGWHSLWYTTTLTPDKSQTVYGMSINFYTDDFASITETITHEIVETVTDPFPSFSTLGIYTNDKGPLNINNAEGAEISDQCNSLVASIGGIRVNGYYSNMFGGCVGDNTSTQSTFVRCNIGAKWDEAKQECVTQAIGAAIFGGAVGNTSNDYDTNKSYYVTRKAPGTFFLLDNDTVDLSGRISRGGDEFTGWVELNDRRKRTGTKANTSTSVLIGWAPTKVDTLMKRVGTLASGPITCVIRNQAGALRATMGTVDSSTILDVTTPISFINTQNTVALAEGDTISIEYALGTASNFLQVRTSNRFFNSADALNTVLFESLSTSLNTTTPIPRRDLAATFYTGGVPDLTARPLRGVLVNNTNSVLFGKAITEVRLKLKGFGILPLGNILRVKIIRGSDKVTEVVLGELDINSISTNEAVEYYFQNTENTYVMKVGDMVALEFNHGDQVHYIEMKTSVSDNFDGQNTVMFESNGTVYTPVTNADVAGTMSIGGFTVTPDPVSVPPTPPFHYAHEWIVAAAGPADSNAQQNPATIFPPFYSFYNNISKQFRIYDFLVSQSQLQNYYENRFTITPIPKGRVEIVGHDISPIESLPGPVIG